MQFTKGAPTRSVTIVLNVESALDATTDTYYTTVVVDGPDATTVAIKDAIRELQDDLIRDGYTSIVMGAFVIAEQIRYA